MTLTFASLFSGGGLADIGMMQAGLKPLWAVEYDPAIAEVYRRNLGDHIIVSRVEDVDYSALPVPGLLWASPSCVRASVANAGGRECEEDRIAARAVCRALEELRPRWFCLENVFQYRSFQSFGFICRTLESLGYLYQWQNVNFAEHGAPQTRRRLILRASRDSLLPSLPSPLPVRGWYEAIEDLIPTLPESQFAPWQLKRLPEDLRESLLIGSQGQNGDLMSGMAEPSPTVTSKSNRGRAFLMMTANTQTEHPTGTGILGRSEPYSPVHSSSDKARAFLVDGQPVPSDDLTIRADGEASFTISASQTHRPVRALLVGGGSLEAGGDYRWEGEEPSCTVIANQDRVPLRAHAAGRVVKLTPRCLARFQTVPDWYVLPEKTSLACKVIGNGVPCEMVRRVVSGMVAGAERKAA